MALAENPETMAYDPNEIILPEVETEKPVATETEPEEGDPDQEGSVKAKPRKDPIWKGFVSGIKKWLEDDDIE
jgi:hypothetical protein